MARADSLCLSSPLRCLPLLHLFCRNNNLENAASDAEMDLVAAANPFWEAAPPENGSRFH